MEIYNRMVTISYNQVVLKNIRLKWNSLQELGVTAMLQ